MNQLLKIKNLNKSFGGLHAVNNVSFSVKKGEIKAVIGPNGAGKTTLFNLISGNLKIDSGKIIFNDKDITGKPSYKIADYGLSRTFQNIKLNSNMSVLENVMLGSHTQSKADFFSCMFNLPWVWKEENKIRENALSLLKKFSIDTIKDSLTSDLSFGQQRSTELARALASRPILLLLDEPAAGLNMYETEELAQMILKIRDEGISILIVEHDMSLVMDISDEIVVLNYGEKIAEGKPREIQKNKKVIESYLGVEDA